MCQKFLALMILAIGFLMTNACEIVDYPPKRPDSVDSDAVWAGGVDGGSWVTCKDVASTNNTFRCRVFAERGGLITEDDFVLATATFRGKAGDADFEVTYHAAKEKRTANDLLAVGYNHFDGKIGLMDHTVLMRPNKLDSKFAKFDPN